MMKRLLFSIVLIGTIVCLSTSCNNQKHITNFDKVESFKKDNECSIQIICDYLLKSEYDSVYIDDANGQMYAGFEYIEIEDPTVNDCIKSLWKEKCKNISLITENNAITFRLGQTLIEGIEYGLAYPINDTSEIRVQFQTELIPLYNSKYYYYVSDYNEWRISN